MIVLNRIEKRQGVCWKVYLKKIGRQNVNVTIYSSNSTKYRESDENVCLSKFSKIYKIMRR